MASGSNLNWKNITRCNSLKICSAASAPHVRQTELYHSSPVPNLCLQVFRKQFKALHEHSEEMKSERYLKKWMWLAEILHVTQITSSHFLQDQCKFNLTLSIQSNTPTVRVKIWKSFVSQVKEQYKENTTQTTMHSIYCQKENRSTSQFKRGK